MVAQLLVQEFQEIADRGGKGVALVQSTVARTSKPQRVVENPMTPTALVQLIVTNFEGLQNSQAQSNHIPTMHIITKNTTTTATIEGEEQQQSNTKKTETEEADRSETKKAEQTKDITFMVIQMNVRC